MLKKFYWWYIGSPLLNYTWRIHHVNGIIKCKINKHFWASVTNRKNYQFCIRCKKEKYDH